MRDLPFRFSIPAARRCAFVWLAVAAAAGTPAAARAEGFFDLYAGAAFPVSSHVGVHADDPTINNNPSFLFAYPPVGHHDWETSPTVGLRGGYWFSEQDLPFLGFGLDLSYYRAFEDTHFAPIKVWAVPMTPMLMLRIPIGVSERYPGGRLQPYVAAGPAFTISAAHADLEDLGIGLRNFEDTSFDVGADARAGLAVQLSPHFGLFSEYRFTYLKPHFHDTVDDAFGAPPDFDAEIDIRPKLITHHMVFGIAFYF